MEICEQTWKTIEEQVEQWVEQTTTKVEQVCETVTQQIDQWQQMTETTCSQVKSQVCSWMPWPLNTVCNWVTETVCNVVTWVEKTIKTVVSTVCHTVTSVIKTLTKVIATVITPVLVTVCWLQSLLSGPGGALPTDEVPDFTGVNFDRRGPDGKLIPFIWGVSTAAYQVEGGIENNDWAHFTTSKAIKNRVEKLGDLGGTTLRIEPAGRAVDHWDLDVLAQDLDRASFLGLNAYRVSLEWARIQPTAPDWAVRWGAKTREAAQKRSEADQIETDGGGTGGEGTGDGEGDGEPVADRAGQLRAEAARLEAEAAALLDLPVDPNDFDAVTVAHYQEMVSLITGRGLQPLLTLMHMTLPDWVLFPPIDHDLIELSAVDTDPRFRKTLRGWENLATVKAYEKFIRFVVPFFKEDVKYWCTLNEPAGSVTVAGYAAGVWPPGFAGDSDRGALAYHNLIRAHVAAYDAIKDLAGPEAQVGFSQWIGFARRAPQTLFNKYVVGDNEAAKNQWHYAFNIYFLDAVVFGHHNPNIWRKDEPKIEEGWKDKLDYIALQYYRACDVYHDVLQALSIPWLGGQFRADLRGSDDYQQKYLWNDLGWTIYPGGLFQLLDGIYKRFQKPILITENGTCEAQDRNRAAYTIAHLQQVLRAIKQGVDVIGYVHWSLVDNFEWAFGFQDDAKFGLYTIDRDANPDETGTGSFPRHVTEGALAYQYVIQNSRRITESNSGEDPFEAVLPRFGTISADGLEVEPPLQHPGRLWEGHFPDADGPDFVLYVSRLPGDRWLPLMFFQDTKRWVRLTELQWRPEGELEGTLTFTSPGWGPQAGKQVTHSAQTFATSDGTWVGLHGSARVGNRTLTWFAQRVERAGIWQNTTSAYEPTHIAVTRWEGPSDIWRAKFLYGKRIWSMADEGVAWSGPALTMWLGSVGSFEGTLRGGTLTGTVHLIGGGGGATTPWTGNRLPEDIPFG